MPELPEIMVMPLDQAVTSPSPLTVATVVSELDQATPPTATGSVPPTGVAIAVIRAVSPTAVSVSWPGDVLNPSEGGAAVGVGCSEQPARRTADTSTAAAMTARRQVSRTGRRK